MVCVCVCVCVAADEVAASGWWSERRLHFPFPPPSQAEGSGSLQICGR